jgi:hypothetical protein
MRHFILLSLVALVARSGAEQKFSETQEWDARFTPLAEAESLFEIDWTQIGLPRPPDSAAESVYLVELQKTRTPEIIRTIKQENDEALDPAEYLEPDIGMIAAHENTQRLCQIVRHESGFAVLGQQKKFDRVRPSFVNPEIITVIANPGLPAYPSGHACQIHLLAYCLAAVNPEKSKDYLAMAGAFSKNREVAGVNYPSDSYAGKILAKLMVRKLLDQPSFQGAFFAAATEWPGPSPTDKMIALRAYSLPDPKPSKK